MPRRFCFDIDGTLISSGGAGGRAFKKAIRKIYNREPDWSSIWMAGRLDPAIFQDILLAIGEKPSPKNWLVFKETYLEFMQEEIKNPQGWKVFDGVVELLKTIIANQEQPVLLTGNIREGAFLKLKAVGLDHYFDWENSVFGDEGQKNREELVEPLKLKNRGLTPIVIGDTPADIQVGKLSGGIAIGVATGPHSVEELKKCQPHFALKNLSELFFNDLKNI